MYRTIADFERAWKSESEGTLKILRGLTDASLQQAIGGEARTLGRLAWHLTATLPELANRTGLAVAGPEDGSPPPSSAARIAAAYESAAASLLAEVTSRWSDATLAVEDDMYGERWTRGFTLACLVLHQCHHRGQMTVLMRQAGLAVPGLYGPSREEWAAYGMKPPAV
jgi:uncharacterized damage-inducible protein DinB